MPAESNGHSLCRHVFSPEGHYGAICALELFVLRPRDTFTASVPSRSRRPINVAPGQHTTWRSAWSPASAAPRTRASTMGASAQKSAASDGCRGSSHASRFHCVVCRSVSVCLQNGNGGPLWERQSPLVRVRSQRSPAPPPSATRRSGLHLQFQHPRSEAR